MFSLALADCLFCSSSLNSKWKRKTVNQKPKFNAIYLRNRVSHPNDAKIYKIIIKVVNTRGQKHKHNQRHRGRAGIQEDG